jgi:hypothetical protein
MAITQSTIRNGNGITFTFVVDSSSDWSGVTNSTYFKDLSNGLIYYKDPTGTVQDLYKPSPSVQTVSSSSTVTPTSDNDLVVITGQSVNLTINNPTGNWVQGKNLTIRIKDNGVARTITWDTKYRSIGVTLPNTTIANKTTYVGMMYNLTDDKFDVIGTTTEL